VTALGAQIRVVHRRAAFFGAESAGQLRVGLELGRPAVELPGVAQDHSRAAVHGLHESADAHVHVFVLPQLAHFAAVIEHADDGEAAFLVRRIGSADVEEARSIREFDHIVNMRGDADVFVQRASTLRQQ
jgi:hypothetical protein